MRSTCFRLALLAAILSPITFINGACAQAKDQPAAWKPIAIQLKAKTDAVFPLKKPYCPFFGKRNGIIRVAPQLNRAIGIKTANGTSSVTFKVNGAGTVLLAVAHGVEPKDKSAKLLIENGLTITGMAPVNIYGIPCHKGWNTVATGSDTFVAGVVENTGGASKLDAQQPDGREWRAYLTDSLTDGKQLFEVLNAPADPVINQGMPGTESIQGGFEGGTCVKVGNKYHLFPTERAGEIGVPAYYDRVKTRIGHWESEDAIHWKRVGTIYQASGKYAIAEEDNPMNDRRAAIWSYNAVFNEKEDRWYGYYLTYTVDKNIAPNHSFGRIWCTKSQTKGINGIGGPYDDGQLIMEPGLDSQPWEGRQGVASFYPFSVKDGWLGFYAGAYPFKTWADYPKNSGKGWYIGLAKAKSMDGPWTRLDTTVNPVKSMNPEFLENPLVYQLKNGAYIAIFDGGPDDNGHHFVNMFGYALSKDGLHWNEARYLPIQNKVKQWWNVMRTPLCLIPEGNNVYTVLYAAINGNRFHPIGMVRFKMHPEVLEEVLNGK